MPWDCSSRNLIAPTAVATAGQDCCTHLWVLLGAHFPGPPGYLSLERCSLGVLEASCQGAWGVWLLVLQMEARWKGQEWVLCEPICICRTVPGPG